MISCSLGLLSTVLDRSTLAEADPQGKVMKPTAKGNPDAATDAPIPKFRLGNIRSRSDVCNKFGCLEISFGYQLSPPAAIDHLSSEDDTLSRRGAGVLGSPGGFFLSGAAISANTTLANSKIYHDEFIIDSPHEFVPVSNPLPVPSAIPRTKSVGSFFSPLVSRSSSFGSTPGSLWDSPDNQFSSTQTAGGPAGEDRLQVVCSEEDGWLYCGIYDGFYGRDAADYVATNLYRNIVAKLKSFERVNGVPISIDITEENGKTKTEVNASSNRSSAAFLRKLSKVGTLRTFGRPAGSMPSVDENSKPSPSNKDMASRNVPEHCVQSLKAAFAQTESDFLRIVELEMQERQDLASVGCCVASVLLRNNDLFTLNLGDCRVVMATESSSTGKLTAVQLTVDHSVSNPSEVRRLEASHPGEEVISSERVKGKLKVTGAFGAGFLKMAKFHDPLLAMFRVKNFHSPPYVSSEPHVTARKVTPQDKFIVVGSDGLFEFLPNQELVNVLAKHQETNPDGDPAQFLVEEIVKRAAQKAGISVEMLKSIPHGDSRRRYHDDVTVIVISLQNGIQASTASTTF